MIIKNGAFGGAEMIMLNFARYHCRSEVELHCAYVIETHPDFIEQLRTLSVKCHNLGQGRGGHLLWPIRLYRLLGASFDAIHIHSPLPGSVARVLSRARMGRRPILVTTEHSLWSGYRPSTRLLNRFTVQFDDLVISVSDDATDSMPSRRADAVRTMVHGVALEDFRRSDRSGFYYDHSIAEGPIHFRAIGNFSSTKTTPCCWMPSL